MTGLLDGKQDGARHVFGIERHLELVEVGLRHFLVAAVSGDDDVGAGEARIDLEAVFGRALFSQHFRARFDAIVLTVMPIFI